MTPLKKLKVEEAASTDDLIAQIERKDRRFRLAQTVFMLSTFLALLIVIFIQNQTLNGVQHQLSQAKVTAEKQDSNANKATEKIIRRLDCMTVFFSQKDRTNLTIQDIDQCTLERNGDIQRFFTNNTGGGTTNTKTEQVEGAQTDPKVTSTPTPAAGGANSPAPASTATPLTPTAQPMTILELLQGTTGVPLCQTRLTAIVCR